MSISNKNLRELQILETKRREDIERAELLIENIIAGCDGEQWAIESLAEIFELCKNKGSSVGNSCILKDLQCDLFRWTYNHDDSFLQWKKSFLAQKDTQIKEATEQGEVAALVLDSLQ